MNGRSDEADSKRPIRRHRHGGFGGLWWRGSNLPGEISERQSISQPYLEQLFAKLKANHLVLSVRGPGGGYRLGRDSQDIDVADIVASVDESVDATRCGGKADCQGGEMCLTPRTMVGFKRSDSRFFKRGEFGESRPKESCARDCDQAIDGSTRPDRNPSRTT